jgi:hypothetical protein
MRTSFLFTLAAVVVVAVGCGSQGREQATGSVLQRDLTLVTQTAAVEIASPVEMQQVRIQHRSMRPSQWAARLASARRSVAQPVTTSSTPKNDRELLPGKTVTVIPASSGPSAGSDRTDELPPARGRTLVTGGGGTCRGRGRGPGIAGAPRPDFR